MSADPILILQLRRMGDLILTFPLALDLARRYPQNPIWMAAEPFFFKPLMAFAPTVTFFPPSALPHLAKSSYKAIINLSGAPEAALCAAQCKAEKYFGAVGTPENLRIHGFWQLYRAALTNNNRHNRFHWSDLFRLDLANPLPVFQWQRPRRAKNRRIGLFIGASEITKRPDADFWISLARRLARSGYAPILLGGPGERELGLEIAKKSHAPNFCGKTSLSQLAGLIDKLDLFVTPDTGPMHLADWLGAPVLNLSLGNVSPWETGPLSLGQWVAQAKISCAGCWKCRHSRQLCRRAFSAQAIANLCLNILENQPVQSPPCLEIFKTARSVAGLYELRAVDGQKADSASGLLGVFWRECFLQFHSSETEAGSASFEPLAANYPALCASMGAYLDKLLSDFNQCRRRGQTLPDSFWMRHPLHSRLFAGHCQMWLQNYDYSPAAWNQVLRRILRLREIFAGVRR